MLACCHLCPDLQTSTTLTDRGTLLNCSCPFPCQVEILALVDVADAAAAGVVSCRGYCSSSTSGLALHNQHDLETDAAYLKNEQKLV